MYKVKNTNFRLTLDERQAVDRAARLERQTLSEWVRALVRADLRQKGLWPPQHPLVQNEGVKVR